MKNATKWLANFITPVVLVLVAITGTLVDGLELPVLQGGESRHELVKELLREIFPRHSTPGPLRQIQ